MAITSHVTKRISSQVTKRNPRPRKYASQAERQAAYRARNVMLEFRAEPKTADNISKIADTLGYPRSDVLLSMVKFALTNHDWARFGLTHKTIPTYKENPTMKPASPAQIAARKRFAEMARSGAFKKTVKRKANPAIPMANSDLAMITEIKLFAENDYDLYRQQGKPIIDNLAKKMAKGQFDPAKAVKLYGYLADSAVRKYSVEQMGKRTPTLTILSKNDRELLAQQLFEAYAEEIADTAKQYAPTRKTNPTKRPILKAAMNIRELAYDLENISQDDKKQISDYTDAEILHEAKYVLEIYHESGTVSNDALMGEHGKDEQKSARDDVRKLKALIKKFGATTPRKTNPAKKTVSQKISQLVHEGYPQRQAVAVALSEQRAGKVKRNPSKRTYEVYCQSPGMNIHSWTKLATFYSAEKAKQYAKTYAKAYPSHYVRVESHG